MKVLRVSLVQAQQEEPHLVMIDDSSITKSEDLKLLAQLVEQ